MTISPDRGGEIAVGYSNASGTWQPTVSDLFLPGQGFVVTTPTELVRWAGIYQTGTVGGPEPLNELTKDSVTVDDTARYGAGILESTSGVLFHDGEWSGEHTYFAVAPDRHTAIAMSCNSVDVTTYTSIANTLQEIWSGER
jgi:hypothetical protein